MTSSFPDPLTIDPDALIQRLEARFAQEIARLLGENARLETALAAALEQLRGQEKRDV